MPLDAYQATFTVNGVPYGFDVQTNSYGEQTEANINVRAIPWSGVYKIVVQGAALTPGAGIGSKAVVRDYRAVVYTEVDYLNLRGQRGQAGQLLTPREVGLGTGYQAVLTECRRSDKQDPTDPNGPQTLQLKFTMLE